MLICRIGVVTTSPRRIAVFGGIPSRDARRVPFATTGVTAGTDPIDVMRISPPHMFRVYAFDKHIVAGVDMFRVYAFDKHIVAGGKERW